MIKEHISMDEVEEMASDPRSIADRILKNRKAAGKKPTWQTGKGIRTTKRVSERPIAMAEMVIAKTLNGEKINKTEIALAVGYAPKSASHMRGEYTRSYQTRMMDFIDKMEYVRNEVLEAMKKKDFDRVEAEKLSQIAKNLTHDIQLLSGGKTDNVGVEEDRAVIHTILHEIRNDGKGVPELPEASQAV